MGREGARARGKRKWEGEGNGPRARGKREWQEAWRERDGTGERGREGRGEREDLLAFLEHASVRFPSPVPSSPSSSPFPFSLAQVPFPSPCLLLTSLHSLPASPRPRSLLSPPLASSSSPVQSLFLSPPSLPSPSVLLAPPLSSPARSDVPRLRDPLSFPSFIYSRIVQASVP